MGGEVVVRSLCLVKDEVDVIEETLTAAAAWSTRIYVYDNGSTDGTWDRVRALAGREPAIVPFRSDDAPFSDDLRAKLFRAFAPEARTGDWWCRLDADELYVDDPRTFLARVGPGCGSVWTAPLSYYFTDADAQRYEQDPTAFADGVPVRDRCRYYLNHWSEPRFFRHRRGMVWLEGDGGFPGAMWTLPVHPERIRVQHFPYRSPEQIERRLAARRATWEQGEFQHEDVGDFAASVAGIRSAGAFVARQGPSDNRPTWRDRVVPAGALDHDAHDGSYVMNPALMPSLPAPLPRREVARRRLRRTVGRAVRTIRATTARTA